VFDLSGHREDVEQLVYKTHLVLDVRLTVEAMASADNPYDFEALVEVLARAMLCRSRQFAFPLQPGDSLGIRPELIRGDRGCGQWRMVVNVLPRKR
jgi:hypothetical protein